MRLPFPPAPPSDERRQRYEIPSTFPASKPTGRPLGKGGSAKAPPAVKRLRRTLQDKGYDLTYVKVREGHDWKNWKPLLDDVLLTFFATEQQ